MSPEPFWDKEGRSEIPFHSVYSEHRETSESLHGTPKTLTDAIFVEQRKGEFSSGFKNQRRMHRGGSPEKSFVL